jgi:hypothetical protein
MKQPTFTRAMAVTAILALCLMGLLAGCGGSSRRTTPTTAGPSTQAAATGPNTPGTGGPKSSGSSAGVPTTSAAPTSAPTTPSVRPENLVASQVEVYGDCDTPSVEPSEIVLTCADYGWVLDDLHWSSWTASEATAVGTFVYNDCDPYCAAGHFHYVPGTRVTLTAPARGASGQLVWSHLTQSPEPPGYVTGPFHGGPFPLPTRPI